jgi:hypothetical protein
VVIDHGNRDVPAVLLAFADDGGGDLLRRGGVDRRAVIRAPILADGKCRTGGKRCNDC